jgi:hypothetical protein
LDFYEPVVVRTCDRPAALFWQEDYLGPAGPSELDINIDPTVASVFLFEAEVMIVSFGGMSEGSGYTVVGPDASRTFIPVQDLHMSLFFGFKPGSKIRRNPGETRLMTPPGSEIRRKEAHFIIKCNRGWGFKSVQIDGSQ